MKGENIYPYLPVFAQNAACSLYGWRVYRQRYGGDFPQMLQNAEKRSSWIHEEICDYRNKRIAAFIRHCFETVPYYKNLLKYKGIEKGDINKLEDLKLLPIINKKTVQNRYSEFLSQVVPYKNCIIGHTSGTTGGGLRFAQTLEAIQEQWAVWWRYRSWHGIDFNTWCGYFGGRSIVPLSQKKPPFWRYNVPGKQILYSGYHMNNANMQYYVNHLRIKKPPWVHGYPSLLSLLGSYLLNQGEDLGYQVQWVTIGAENLLPNQKTIIEKAFGVTPRQHYGMAEKAANISECPHGRLHVDEDLAAIEFLPNKDGNGYKIIGTNYTNLATPLVRYEVGDVAEVSNETCPCGRPGRIVKSIDGRNEDYVTLKNGTKIGRMDHVFKDLINIGGNIQFLAL